MSTLTAQPQNVLPPAIVGRFQISLTESKFQQLADKADSLVYNEDNLPEIANFLNGLRAVKKSISETHKTGKEESLRISQSWDKGKRDFEAMVTAIEERPQQEYTRICTDIEKRKREAELETQRKQNIKNGIETNALKFASDIAASTTSQRLTDIERLINLEKGRKEKYQEFLEDAVTRFNELNSLLKTQKETVREHEKILLEKEKAEKEGNDEKLLELHQAQELAETKIEEAKITVQETAIAQSTNSPIQELEPIMPTVKARRTTVKWKVVDIKETAKKMAHWVELTPKDQPIEDYLKSIKDQVLKENKVTFAGIEFYTEKTF